MLLVVGIGVTSDAQVDLQIGKRSLQLRGESVIRVTGPGVQVRRARDDLEIGIDVSVSVNQVSAKRQSRLDVFQLEFCGTFEQRERDQRRLKRRGRGVCPTVKLVTCYARTARLGSVTRH